VLRLLFDANTDSGDVICIQERDLSTNPKPYHIIKETADVCGIRKLTNETHTYKNEFGEQKIQNPITTNTVNQRHKRHIVCDK
jgi:hypothetical protein